jgi:hypothetical protein
MDNLENSLKAIYATEVDAATLERSRAFGKEIATRVFARAATDGSVVTDTYILPQDPDFLRQVLVFGCQRLSSAAIVNPFHQDADARTGFIKWHYTGTPPPFSTVAGSPFYNMVKRCMMLQLHQLH